ncbi:MAG: thioredoxin 2 [Acidimicrobiales bacterium]|jgi:thioredoxin 2
MTTPKVTCPACGTRNRVPVDASGRPRCGKCRLDLPWLADVEGDQFDAVIASSTIPSLVDLWAPWCGPCRAVAPALVELSEELAGQLRVVKVNVDRAPQVQAQLGVQGIPTMVLFDGSREVARQVGAMPKDAIRSWIDQVLGTTATAS